MTYFPTTDQLV